MTSIQDCPICLNAIENTDCCTTECGHHFHSSCIFKNFTNSFSCPMCRKELVDVPQEDEENDEEEDSEWETETELSGSEDEAEYQDRRKLKIRQVHEALKKQGYNETDFISFIISDYYDYKVKVDQAIETRSEALLAMIEKICYGEISVDYRDARSYASVLQGAIRSEDPGAGPSPVQVV